MVIVAALAAVVFAVFLAAVAWEPRSFANAVLLGLALALGGFALAERLADASGRADRLLLLLLLLAVALVPFALACYLVVNGITMLRKEGPRPASVLPALAGTAIIAVIGLTAAAERTGSGRLSLLSTVADLVFGYVSFMLVSYVCYAFVYGLLPRPGGAEFVIVLGAGLRPDGSVPPMLASRLDRGREVWDKLGKRADATAASPAGAGPLLIVSGGKGGDEVRSEAAAMAGYLAGRGVPEAAIVLEDQSRNTEENLRFSQAIMDRLRPGSRCTIVTSDFHAFRAAMIARRLGLRGQVAGARVAGYYRPGAMLREFAAVFLRFRVVNGAVCAALVCVPAAVAAVHEITGR
jgi:uncharacterized SAM-binding protein YcdF (DUF218 family)